MAGRDAETVRLSITTFVLLVVVIGAQRRDELRGPTFAPPRSVCAAVIGDRVVAFDCGEAASPMFFADARARAATGAPPCWWTATEPQLETLDDVGPQGAARLAAYRDASRRGDSVAPLPPTLAAAAAHASRRCTRVALPSAGTAHASRAVSPGGTGWTSPPGERGHAVGRRRHRVGASPPRPPGATSQTTRSPTARRPEPE
ncbi:MAG: hypothetical protein H6698_03635 [Myxococcales bacterium]|nr:hypothetical protein [Myxococcales bacterium]